MTNRSRRLWMAADGPSARSRRAAAARQEPRQHIHVYTVSNQGEVAGFGAEPPDIRPRGGIRDADTPREAGPGASARLAVAALAAAAALAGCAPVGPDFLRPAALVSPEYKEIAGWKVATPRGNESKGDWWSVFRDPELSRLEEAVAISNQTVRADEANYREALALINEARAGLFPTVNGTGSATRSAIAGTALTTVTAEASGTWTHRRVGPGAAGDRGADGQRRSERRHSRQRLARGAGGAGAGLRPGAPGRTRWWTC